MVAETLSVTRFMSVMCLHDMPTDVTHTLPETANNTFLSPRCMLAMNHCTCNGDVASIPIYYQIKLFSITNNSQLDRFYSFLTLTAVCVPIQCKQ